MPLMDYLDDVDTILVDLKNVKVKFDEEDDALVLLCSFLPSYKNFISSFVIKKYILFLWKASDWHSI